MVGTSELILILLVALLLFGGKRLPELAKSLGLALNEFRNATTIKPKEPEEETSNSESE